MRKFDFISMMDLDSGLEKKCIGIESDILLWEKKIPEARRAGESLSEKIFEVHEDYRKSQVIGDPDNVISEKQGIYIRMLSQKSELTEGIRTKAESRRSELSVLLSPIKARATEILNRTLVEIQAMYIMETPAVRVGAGGRILSHIMKDIDSGKKTMLCKTNGTAIRQSKQVLIAGLGKVNQSLSLSEFKKVLSDLSKELNSENFEAEELTVNADDFEDLSRRFPAEVGYLISGKPVVLKQENARASLETRDGGPISGRNPW